MTLRPVAIYCGEPAAGSAPNRGGRRGRGRSARPLALLWIRRAELGASSPPETPVTVFQAQRTRPRPGSPRRLTHADAGAAARARPRRNRPPGLAASGDRRRGSPWKAGARARQRHPSPKKALIDGGGFGFPGIPKYLAGISPASAAW